MNVTQPAAERRPVERHEARQWEERFLEAAAAKAGRLAAIALRPGGRPVARRRLDCQVYPFDRADQVKRVMADQGLYDRAVLDQMPQNGARVVEFSRRQVFGGRRKAVTVVALAVNPLAALAAEGRADQAATLAEAIRRLDQLITRDGTFYHVAAFSPTGWEPRALVDIPAGDDYELYLVEKGDGTQWLVHGRGALLEVFDPETKAERLARCRAFVEAHRGETMLAGLAAEDLSRALLVAPVVAQEALREAARRDPHLRLQPIGGALRLVHTDEPVSGTGAGESPERSERSSMMGLWHWLLVTLRIRKKAPDPEQVIRELEDLRARAQVQRDEIDSRIADLEKTNHELGEQLRAETAKTRQTSLAQAIANVRHRIKQMQRRVTIFDKAISVYNTHVDNLTLAKEARGFRLPTEVEMKDIAVEVDGLVDEINEAADLALGMDAGAAAETVSPEVEAILAEFGAGEAKAKAPAEPRRAATPERRPAAPAPEVPQVTPRQKAPPTTD